MDSIGEFYVYEGEPNDPKWWVIGAVLTAVLVVLYLVS